MSILLLFFLEEGIRPIFDRDEIKHWIPDVPEKRLIAMIPEKSTDYARKRSLSPFTKRTKRSTSREQKGITQIIG